MPGLVAPLQNSVLVSPSDSVNPFTPYTAIFVGGAGNISYLTPGGQTVSLVGVLAGSYLEIGVRRINLTGTTATNIIGYW